MRRGLGVALLLCLAGAVLLLAGAGATWTTLVVEGRAPLPDRAVDVSGSDLVPGLRALGVLGLAGVAALLGARRTGRVAVGLLLAAAGAGVLVLTLRALLDLGTLVYGTSAYRGAAGAPAGSATYGSADLSATGWPYAVALGGALLLLAGLLAVVRGRAWPALGARFDAPRTAGPAVEEPTDKSTWDALDRGDDPTRSAGADARSLGRVADPGETA